MLLHGRFVAWSAHKVQDTDRDRFMSWEEAVRYGLVDRVLEKRGEIPPEGAPRGETRSENKGGKPA